MTQILVLILCYTYFIISSHFAPVEQLHLRELVEKLQEKRLRGRKTMVPYRLSFANPLNNVATRNAKLFWWDMLASTCATLMDILLCLINLWVALVWWHMNILHFELKLKIILNSHCIVNIIHHYTITRRTWHGKSIEMSAPAALEPGPFLVVEPLRRIPSGYVNSLLLNMASYSGFSYEKWWFSIVLCMFTRGYESVGISILSQNWLEKIVESAESGT